MSYFNLRSLTFDQPRGDPKSRLGTKAIQRCGVTETTVNGGRIRPLADLDAELEELPVNPRRSLQRAGGDQPRSSVESDRKNSGDKSSMQLIGYIRNEAATARYSATCTNSPDSGFVGGASGVRTDEEFLL